MTGIFRVKCGPGIFCVPNEGMLKRGGFLIV